MTHQVRLLVLLICTATFCWPPQRAHAASEESTLVAMGLCSEMERLINVLVDYTQTKCIPVMNGGSGLSFLFISSQPVFSVDASVKAWALTVVGAYGHTFNPRPSYKLDSIYLSDLSLIRDQRTAEALKGSTAKKLQKQIYDGKIELEAAWSQIKANMKPYKIPEKSAKIP
ncbi:MAG: hypothetical protein AB7H77_06865 [Bdellovibrionales bacterium]